MMSLKEQVSISFPYPKFRQFLSQLFHLINSIRIIRLKRINLTSDSVRCSYDHILRMLNIYRFETYINIKVLHTEKIVKTLPVEPDIPNEQGIYRS